jgi:hypothetical protein
MRRPKGGLDVAAGSGTIEREEDASWGEVPRLARPSARGLKPERGAERATRRSAAQPRLI